MQLAQGESEGGQGYHLTPSTTKLLPKHEPTHLTPIQDQVL